MKNRRQRRSIRPIFSAAGLVVTLPCPAWAVNVSIEGGWPCNIWMNHSGALGAAGNLATFNVKDTPSSTASASGFISGAESDYLTKISKSFNSLISTLPLLEPLTFNLGADTFGARLGVDVCIPAIDVTRDDVVDWSVTVSSVGALMPPAEGDWFSLTSPKVGMNLLASNCNTAAGTPMSTSIAEKPLSCFIATAPSAGSDAFTFAGQSLNFTFKHMASREMALRFSLEEQSTAVRPHSLNAGVVSITLTSPDLPPLLVGDLLGKQLFYAPDSRWPGCADFNNTSGMAFSAMNLQGPESSLNLSWTGEDTDCTKSSGCSDGNVGDKNFGAHVNVYLDDGTLAPPNTSPTAKVKEFMATYLDNDLALPHDGSIRFETGVDQVYRSKGKAFFSTTVTRETASGIRSCRVWFKRDNGFECLSLPLGQDGDTFLRTLCQNML